MFRQKIDNSATFERQNDKKWKIRIISHGKAKKQTFWLVFQSFLLYFPTHFPFVRFYIPSIGCLGGFTYLLSVHLNLWKSHSVKVINIYTYIRFGYIKQNNARNVLFSFLCVNRSTAFLFITTTFRRSTVSRIVYTSTVIAGVFLYISYILVAQLSQTKGCSGLLL